MSEENKNLQDESLEEKEEINNGAADSDASVEESEISDNAEAIGSVAESEQANEVTSAESDLKKPPKKKKKKIKLGNVTVGAYVFSLIAVIVATVLLTYSICAEVFKDKYADKLVFSPNSSVQTPTTQDPEQDPEQNPALDPESLIDTIEQYIDAFAYAEVDKNEMVAAALKAYVMATGDPYAYYYTLEELIKLQEDGASKLCGIGVNVAYEVIDLDGEDVSTVHIFHVMANSPALEAGLMTDDLIVEVTTAEGVKTVTELGYDGTLDAFLGEEGTKVDFAVLRKNADGEYEKKQFSIERRMIESESVFIEPLELASDIGLVKLTEFNYKTPIQFEAVMEKLIADGCEKFIIDLRGNPGGYEVSIAAVLSFFLDEGDVYIQTKDSAGNVEKSTIAPVSYAGGDLQGCNIDEDKIGKYKDLNVVVLCDENTASAAELFTASFKDYELGTVVGETTHGKGCMQNTFMLNSGFSGAVKLTTHMYYSGGDTELVGYDQVGITPDVEVANDEKFSEINAHIVPQSEDAQLNKAVELLSK